jgi:hypothetical protein
MRLCDPPGGSTFRIFVFRKKKLTSPFFWAQPFSALRELWQDAGSVPDGPAFTTSEDQKLTKGIPCIETEPIEYGWTLQLKNPF